MKSKNCIVIPYDKFNRTELENQTTLEICKHTPLDYVVCANVLCVIYEDDIINSILKHIHELSNEETIILFSIYEGNKSNIGKETSKGYQRNCRIIEYNKYISKYFTYEIKNNIFICKKK